MARARSRSRTWSFPGRCRATRRRCSGPWPQVRCTTLAIEVFDAGGSVPFATYTFDHAVVTSNVLGSSTSAVSEQQAFDFRRITSDVTVNGQTFHNRFDMKALSSCSQSLRAGPGASRLQPRSHAFLRRPG